MSTHEPALLFGASLALVVGAGLALAAVVAAAAPASQGPESPPGIGKAIAEADIAAWDIDAAPSGKGLPTGSGTAAQGAKVYADQCAGCHKPDLTGGGVPGAGPLIGGPPLTNGMGTATTIRNYWGHSTTLFDYIRRAMPIQAPRTLSNDEVYALTAFLLEKNRIIPADQVMNAQTLPQVRMPAADIFIVRFPGLL